ncbi:MAG: excinuclease ABC subunit UvrC [Dehalococcoidia bacterium]|nr:excinuclease ABC subunit UvrC [Dehalococcoidia bacterium]
MIKPHIVSYLKLLPHRPGVYTFRDVNGAVIYIGKASNLRNRVKSYFKYTPNLSEKTARMVQHIDKIEFVITESEIAALVLECQQIKKHRPPYNILLKDDKSFPYIKVDVKNEWPTISITRRRYNDGAKYIGRVPSAWSARQTYDFIKKVFPLRSCDKKISGKEIRPCLKYHIRRCYGPCIGAISKEEYQAVVRQVVAVLEGKEVVVLRHLKKAMAAASHSLEFEKAAALRNQAQAIEAVVASNNIPLNIRGEQDAIAIARDSELACVRIFSIRNTRLAGDEYFILNDVRGEPDARLLEGFIKQYYSSTDHIPGLILLQSPIDERLLITEWLKSKRGSSVEMRVPQKGAGLRLINMVMENAHQQLEIYKNRRAARPENLKLLANLKEILSLSRFPHRIEAYDISNIQGTNAVGSMVVFEDGGPRPSNYRRFRIRSVAVTDDYAMMSEMIRRRFKEHVKDGGKWASLPDLVLIDGGKGHLHAAISAMREAGTTDIAVASIAKENEDIYLPGFSEPVPMEKSSPELHLLQRVRDEAHRFAITYHKSVRAKAARESALDSVSGIGPARKKALIKRFGSVRKIREARIEELTAVEGITPGLAQRILESL